MIRRPPTPTLFPYTTLFLSSRAKSTATHEKKADRCPTNARQHGANCSRLRNRCCSSIPTSKRSGCRSEEHTSELQSLTNLVCRLLLEKKKKTTECQLTIDEW